MELIDWSDKREELMRILSKSKRVCSKCGLELSIARGCSEMCLHCGNQDGCED